MLAGLTAAGALTGLILPLTILRNYTSTLRLVIGPGRGGLNSCIQAAVQPLLSRPYLRSLITSESLYPEELAEQPMEDVVETMRKSFDIEVASRNHVNGTVRVSFRYHNAVAGTRLLQKWIGALRQSTPPATACPGALTLEPAEPTRLQDSSWRRAMAAIGLAPATASALLNGSVQGAAPAPQLDAEQIRSLFQNSETLDAVTAGIDPSAQTREQLDAAAKQWRGRLRVEPGPLFGELRVSYTASSPEEARALLRDLANAVVSAHGRRVHGITDTPRVEVLEQATLPESPDGAAALPAAALGATAALLAGFCWIWRWRRLLVRAARPYPD